MEPYTSPLLATMPQPSCRPVQKPVCCEGIPAPPGVAWHCSTWGMALIKRTDRSSAVVRCAICDSELSCKYRRSQTCGQVPRYNQHLAHTSFRSTTPSSQVATNEQIESHRSLDISQPMLRAGERLIYFLAPSRHQQMYPTIPRLPRLRKLIDALSPPAYIRASSRQHAQRFHSNLNDVTQMGIASLGIAGCKSAGPIDPALRTFSHCATEPYRAVGASEER
jgi:hypothetical protein